MYRFIAGTQLPLSICQVLFEKFNVVCLHTTHYENGHLMADKQIRKISIEENFIVIKKDKDFADHFLLFGPPPKIFFLQIGNCSNKTLFSILEKKFSKILQLFDEGTDMVAMDTDKNNCY